VKALITGSQGFAGRHFRQALDIAGWAVTGIDLTGAAPQDARRFFARDETHFDLVLHCAAVVGGRAMIDGPPLALAANLETDAGLFQWALRTGQGRIVYISSSAAYPVALQDRARRLHEDDLDLADPRMPDQLYGWAKLTGEILAARAQSAGLDVTVVRPFSGYGEDQDTSYPFPAFAARARAHADPFLVWGNGAQTRDFIHIDDIVAAVLTLTGQGASGPVNLGSGRPVTMMELAGMFTHAAGYRPRIVTRPDAPAGVFYRVANPDQMHKFCTPAVSLEEGVRRAVA
jgi:nucleoside-diphosphate-sugar epimerase